jgi:methylmalonyl-CoA mutase N-terminal domain/subunit
VAGSFAIEAKTDEIEEAAEALIARVDEMGGMVRAIESGFPQREIHESAWRHQQAVEKGEARVVGVNVFTDAEEKAAVPAIHRIRPESEREQADRVRQWRRGLDARAAHQALDGLEKAEKRQENLMPSILRAVGAGATLGQICDVLRRAWGEHEDRPFL